MSEALCPSCHRYAVPDATWRKEVAVWWCPQCSQTAGEDLDPTGHLVALYPELEDLI